MKVMLRTGPTPFDPILNNAAVIAGIVFCAGMSRAEEKEGSMSRQRPPATANVSCLLFVPVDYIHNSVVVEVACRDVSAPFDAPG